MHAIITMPVFNDWKAASLLCLQLSQELAVSTQHTATILLIDDGSSCGLDTDGLRGCCNEFLTDVKVLTLNRNLGHQRAIAIALTYIQQNFICDGVVVMDADGEDRASDVPRLLAALSLQRVSSIVFAERGRRVEGPLFRTFYVLYRLLHRFATGTGIRVGNFSAIPADRLQTLVVLPELWNHYAAAVLKARIPHTTVIADRGRRLHGESKMNFVSLVIHGLSALFAHHDLVGTRIFVSLAGLSGLLIAGFLLFSGIWLYNGWPVPLWQMIAMATAVLLAGDLLAISFVLVFFIMMSRSNQGFLPVRDYGYFVMNCASVVTTAESVSSRSS